jgi:hypothetical protein
VSLETSYNGGFGETQSSVIDCSEESDKTRIVLGESDKPDKFPTSLKLRGASRKSAPIKSGLVSQNLKYTFYPILRAPSDPSML